MKPPLEIVVICGLLVGCSKSADFAPTPTEVAGRWVAVHVSPHAEDFFRRGGAVIDRSKPPAFELRQDGSLVASNLPLVLGAEHVVICDASGKWRLHPSLSRASRSELLLILEEPKRGVGYECFKDERGIFLRWYYDYESPDAVVFRKA